MGNFLGMSWFDLVGNSIFLGGLLVVVIWKLVLTSKEKKNKPQRRDRTEIKSELSRRHQEDDELTAIMREANSDDLYTD